MTSDPAALLLEALLQDGAGRVSLIGLSKNAGKTVTLNQLIRAAAGRGVALGLLSTGRDGEAVDAVTELPKPRIWAPAGAWVATARGALAGGSARVAVVRETPHPTPFGPLIIGQVTEPGELLLIGPGSATRIGALLADLEAAGAALCLVDGSFDRRASAAPAVTGRAVLAAGAAYSSSMEETVAQVRHLLELFDLPRAPEGALERLCADGAAAPVRLLPREGPPLTVPVVSALADPEAVADAAAAAPPGSLLALTGALTDRLLLSLLGRRLGQVGLLLPDPTHLLVSRSAWRRWRNQGGQAWVERPVRLLAVTANPHSPVGTDYDPQLLCARIAAIAGRPVFDLQAGLALLP